MSEKGQNYLEKRKTCDQRHIMSLHKKYARHSSSPSDMSDDAEELHQTGANHRDKHSTLTGTGIRVLVLTGFMGFTCMTLFHYLQNSIVSHTWIEETADVSRHLPHCIGIGVRKCGTRALLEFLSLHPDISIARDEIHFFDKQKNYDKDMDWYLNEMPLSTAGQLTMEKSPAYFISAEAPKRVAQMNSSIKLLVIMRDPITRIISDYTQVYTKRKARNISHTPLEKLVIDQKTGEVNLQYKPIQISIYHQHWIHWRAHFDWSQFHIVDGEKLIKDPLPELLEVEKFLGVKPFLSEDNVYFNETRGFYCMRSQTKESRCLGSSKGRPHPQLDPKVLEILRNFYRPHNQLLYELVDRHFDWD